MSSYLSSDVKYLRLWQGIEQKNLRRRKFLPLGTWNIKELNISDDQHIHGRDF